jgi:hypothetical protein
MPRNKLTRHVITVRKRYAEGETALELASEFKVSKTSIYAATSGRTHVRGGGIISRRHKPVTTFERDEMQQRYKAGQSLYDIAAQMGRPYATVYYWCVRKAGEE